MSNESSRKRIYGLNLAVMVIAMIVVLGVVNWLGTKHYKRWDLAKPAEDVLSDQTINLLQSLDKDVKLTYLYTQSVDEMEDRTQEDWKDLLERYKSLSSHFDYEMIDFVKNPTRARAFMDNIKLTLEANSSVIQSGEYTEKINETTEAALTSAIIKVTRGEVRTVCFTEGHGEHDPDKSGTGGYYTGRNGLETENFSVDKINILSGGVPEKCDIIAIAGPIQPFHKEEAAALDKWLAGGGKLMALLDATGPTGLEKVLGKYGLVPENDVLKTDEAESMGIDPFFVIAESYNPTHAVTQLSSPLVLVGDRIGSMPSIFFEARSIKVKDNPGEGIEADSLVTSTDGVRVLPSSEAPLAKRNPELKFATPEAAIEDKAPIGEVGPQVVAAYVMKPVEKAEDEEAVSTPEKETDEEKTEVSTRIVLFGDSDFAADGFIDQYANADLFLNSFAWLAQEVGAIGIRPKKKKFVPIHFSGQRNWLILFGVLFIVPLVVLVNGLLVWREKKRM